MDSNAKVHPIGFVSKQTGLSPHLIRAWEKRYGVVKPGRTATNRRLYSDNDIKHLKQIQGAISSGHRIAQLAGMDSDSLQNLVGNSMVKGGGELQPSIDTPDPDNLLEICFQAVQDMDSDGLESALSKAGVLLTRPILFEKVIVPLIKKIGESWSQGSLKIINEHMASAVLRSFLWDMLRSTHVPQTAPKIVIATTVDQWHELGALIIAVTAADCGWHALYCGPNLPAEEIAAAVWKNRARAVALSIVYQTEAAPLVREIKKLRRLLDEDVELIIGGNAVSVDPQEWDRVGIHQISDLHEFTDFLNRLL